MKPTLNAAYNELLAKWAASGHDATPECEICGANLTGKNVYDTADGWAGDCCACAEDEAEYSEDEDEPIFCAEDTDNFEDEHASLDDWSTRRAEMGWSE